MRKGRPDFFFGLVAVILLNLIGISSLKGQFVKGADVSWLQQMESTGFQFYDSLGNPTDCLELLKSYGINTVRLGVLVNPSNDRLTGHCSRKEVALMALRAKKLGMKVMIVFHYSDTRADAGRQDKPAAWANHTYNQLVLDIYYHTRGVLDTLRRCGVRPDFVQLGNEITWGMLWPDGGNTKWDQLAAFLNKGYEATKSIDTSIRVVIHIGSGNDGFLSGNFFNNARQKNVRFDIIGISYYPTLIGTDYRRTINDLGTNLKVLAERYKKDVMVVETAGAGDDAGNTYEMITGLMEKMAEVPCKRGLGVIYREPQAAQVWSAYPLSCFTDKGVPTRAMNAFLRDSSGIIKH